MKKLFILMTVAAFCLTAGSAMAVPYALIFDADAAGATYAAQTIYGWDMEGIGEDSLGGTTVNLLTDVSLGADDVLGNGDTFTESFTLVLSNGLDAGLDALNGQNGYYQGFPPIVPASNLYVDMSLAGVIASYNDGGTPTTAANVASLADDSFVSVFTGGSATLYVDADADRDFDGGETVVATFSLDNAGNFIFVPSVYAGTAAVIDFAFAFDTINTNYFATAPGFQDLEDLVNQGFVLTLAQGGVASQAIIGDTTADPDRILFGWDETGIDSRFSSVPEPASMLLLGTGLLGFAGLGRKKFRK